ncbi:MAG: MATE family efflux transporter [Bacteroidales bacterium]
MILQNYLPFYKRNLNLALPVMITQAGQMIVQFADNIMVGHLGTEEFAGVAFANSLFTIGMIFCIGFTQGLTPYAGQSFGKGNHREVSKYFQNSFIMDIFLCLAVLVVMFSIMPFMQYMGQDPSILEYAKSYYIILVISLVPFILFFAIRNFSEGIGITKYAMYITIVSNLVNIFLNWILIFGHWGFPAMGVSGAAIATLISRVLMFISFAFIIITVNPYKQYLRLIRRPLIDIIKIKELLKTSVPISLQGLVEVTAFSLSGIMVGWFGKEALAANQIALTITTFSFMIAQGIGVAATIRVSHQFGEKRYADARKAGFAAAHLSVGFMGTAGIIYILFRHNIPYVFTSDPAVATIAASLLIISAGFQIFDAIQLSGIASLRALADVKIPLLFSIISYYLICLPLGYFCGHVLNLGPMGIWVGLMLGLIFAAILFMYRFNKITKRYIEADLKSR